MFNTITRFTETATQRPSYEPEVCETLKGRQLGNGKEEHKEEVGTFLARVEGLKAGGGGAVSPSGSGPCSPVFLFALQS